MHATDPSTSLFPVTRLPAGFLSFPLPRLLILWGALTFLFAWDALAAELRGRVAAVADGDTITVVDAARETYRVRLAGIDAPEKSQPYGAEARRHLAALVLGKPVTVIWHKHDRYRRLVGVVDLAIPGECSRPDCARVEDVGLAQVESGLAWHYRQYQREQSPEDRRRYAAAEQEARAKREGLWRDANPVPPWEYRNGHRAAVHARRGDGRGDEKG